MNVTSRARWALARRPWLYWLAVGVLAVGAGLLVADAVGAASTTPAGAGATSGPCSWRNGTPARASVVAGIVATRVLAGTDGARRPR